MSTKRYLDWSETDYTWGDNPFIWSDVSIVTDAAQIISGGGTQDDLDKWLKEEPEKKKRLIKLKCIINDKEYRQTKNKELKSKKITIKDIKIIIDEFRKYNPTITIEIKNNSKEI